MADLHKEINTNERLGGELRRTLDRIATDLACFAQLRATMDAMDDGTTRAAVEARFGLKPGSGADVVYQLAAVKAELDGCAVLHEMLNQFEAAIIV